MKKVSVMIPTYNEEENVVQMHSELTCLFEEQLSSYDYEILFIDNKSTDRTRELLRQLCRDDRHTKAILNVKDFGQFNSPYYGILNTSGDCVIPMCADFQDPLEMIPVLISEWENGHKVICCVKTKSKERRIMFFFRSIYYKLIKKMSDVEQIEHFTGFGLYDKSFVEVLRTLNDPIPFMRGIVSEFSSDRKIIEYEQAKRRAGKSKNNFYTLYDAAMISFTSYTKMGLRVATISGFIIGVVSLIISLVYLVLKLLFWYEMPLGTAPILIGVFFFGSLQMFFIGLVGEYIMSINKRVMNRPLVIEEERIGFEE